MDKGGKKKKKAHLFSRGPVPGILEKRGALCRGFQSVSDKGGRPRGGAGVDG